MRLLTVKEVAELLKMRENTVYQLIREGIVPSVKIKGSIRVDYDDLVSFIESNKKRGGERRGRGRKPELKFPIR